MSEAMPFHTELQQVERLIACGLCPQAEQKLVETIRSIESGRVAGTADAWARVLQLQARMGARGVPAEGDIQRVLDGVVQATQFGSPLHAKALWIFRRGVGQSGRMRILDALLEGKAADAHGSDATLTSAGSTGEFEALRCLRRISRSDAEDLAWIDRLLRGDLAYAGHASLDAWSRAVLDGTHAPEAHWVRVVEALLWWAIQCAETEAPESGTTSRDATTGLRSGARQALRGEVAARLANVVERDLGPSPTVDWLRFHRLEDDPEILLPFFEECRPRWERWFGPHSLAVAVMTVRMIGPVECDALERGETISPLTALHYELLFDAVEVVKDARVVGDLEGEAAYGDWSSWRAAAFARRAAAFASSHAPSSEGPQPRAVAIGEDDRWTDQSLAEIVKQAYFVSRTPAMDATEYLSLRHAILAALGDRAVSLRTDTVHSCAKALLAWPELVGDQARCRELLFDLARDHFARGRFGMGLLLIDAVLGHSRQTRSAEDRARDDARLQECIEAARSTEATDPRERFGQLLKNIPSWGSYALADRLPSELVALALDRRPELSLRQRVRVLHQTLGGPLGARAHEEWRAYEAWILQSLREESREGLLALWRSRSDHDNTPSLESILEASDGRSASRRVVAAKLRWAMTDVFLSGTQRKSLCVKLLPRLERLLQLQRDAGVDVWNESEDSAECGVGRFVLMGRVLSHEDTPERIEEGRWQVPSHGGASEVAPETMTLLDEFLAQPSPWRRSTFRMIVQERGVPLRVRLRARLRAFEDQVAEGLTGVSTGMMTESGLGKKSRDHTFYRYITWRSGDLNLDELLRDLFAIGDFETARRISQGSLVRESESACAAGWSIDTKPIATTAFFARLAHCGTDADRLHWMRWYSEHWRQWLHAKNRRAMFDERLMDRSEAAKAAVDCVEMAAEGLAFIGFDLLARARASRNRGLEFEGLDCLARAAVAYAICDDFLSPAGVWESGPLREVAAHPVKSQSSDIYRSVVAGVVRDEVPGTRGWVAAICVGIEMAKLYQDEEQRFRLLDLLEARAAEVDVALGHSPGETSQEITRARAPKDDEIDLLAE